MPCRADAFRHSMPIRHAMLMMPCRFDKLLPRRCFAMLRCHFAARMLISAGCYYAMLDATFFAIIRCCRYFFRYFDIYAAATFSSSDATMPRHCRVFIEAIFRCCRRFYATLAAALRHVIIRRCYAILFDVSPCRCRYFA